MHISGYFMHKDDRQDTIISILESRQVASQTELVGLLRDSGFEATQASISRDLEDLGVLKVGGFYTVPLRDKLFGTVSFDVAGDNLIIAKCSSGLASAITVRIDRQSLPEVVG